VTAAVPASAVKMFATHDVAIVLAGEVGYLLEIPEIWSLAERVTEVVLGVVRESGGGAV